MRPSLSSALIQRSAVVAGTPDARQRLVTEIRRCSISEA
jgi:hypothetical protein